MKGGSVRKAVVALAVVVLAARGVGVEARGFWYEGEGYGVEIPEESGTYYYTARGTNMSGSMLEKAEAQGPECLIGGYSEAGKLEYTYKVESVEGEREEIEGEGWSEGAGGPGGWEREGESESGNKVKQRIEVLEEEGGWIRAKVITAQIVEGSAGEAKVDAILASMRWDRGEGSEGSEGSEESEGIPELSPVYDPVEGVEGVEDPSGQNEQNGQVESERNEQNEQNEQNTWALSPVEEEAPGALGALGTAGNGTISVSVEAAKERLAALIEKARGVSKWETLSGAVLAVTALMWLLGARKRKGKRYRPRHDRRRKRHVRERRKETRERKREKR